MVTGKIQHRQLPGGRGRAATLLLSAWGRKLGCDQGRACGRQRGCIHGRAATFRAVLLALCPEQLFGPTPLLPLDVAQLVTKAIGRQEKPGSGLSETRVGPTLWEAWPGIHAMG